MFPNITIVGRIIPMYSVCIFSGILVGTGIAVLLSPKFSVNKEDCFYAMCFAVMGVVVGGKVLYLLVSIKQLPELLQTVGIMGILQGGFVFYGSLVGAILMVFVYCKKFKLKSIQVMSPLIVVTPLIQSFGRIGCLCGGCCYGMPWKGSCAVFIAGEMRFPVQLLESGLCLLLFICLLVCSFFKSRKLVMPLYLCGYGLIRIVCEQFRGDAVRGFIGPLSTSTIISLISICAGVALIVYIVKNEKCMNK